MSRITEIAAESGPTFTGVREDAKGKRRLVAGMPSVGEKYFLTAIEGERFLRIVGQVAGIRRHFELFQLLQGEIQHFIPHQILIGAWGDFLEPDLNLDVISAIAGVRTDQLGGCNIQSLFKRLYLRWLASDRQPLLFDCAAPELRTYPACDCALHKSLQRMRSLLVHGFHDARDATDSLYLVAQADAIANSADTGRFAFLVDSLIAQIDTAFRRVAGLRSAEAAATEGACVLSGREKEILAWVSEGRTNHEISVILSISTFTVKNHVQRIIKKLGAGNRTEAAAKYRQLAAGARRDLDLQARAMTANGGLRLAVK